MEQNKDPKYKKLWYEISRMDLIILNDGLYQLIPVKRDVGWNSVDKKRLIVLIFVTYLD